MHMEECQTEWDNRFEEKKKKLQRSDSTSGQNREGKEKVVEAEKELERWWGVSAAQRTTANFKLHRDVHTSRHGLDVGATSH